MEIYNMSYYVFKNSGFKRQAFKFAIFYVLKVVCRGFKVSEIYITSPHKQLSMFEISILPLSSGSGSLALFLDCLTHRMKSL